MTVNEYKNKEKCFYYERLERHLIDFKDKFNPKNWICLGLYKEIQNNEVNNDSKRTK